MLFETAPWEDIRGHVYFFLGSSSSVTTSGGRRQGRERVQTTSQVWMTGKERARDLREGNSHTYLCLVGQFGARVMPPPPSSQVLPQGSVQESESHFLGQQWGNLLVTQLADCFPVLLKYKAHSLSQLQQT